MVNLTKLRDSIADILFPEHNACHLCGRFPERAGVLCSHCMEELNAIRYKKLRSASDEPHLPLEVCLSAWPHQGAARDLVHQLKYQSDCAAAELLGEGMAAALVISPYKPAVIDAVVPVPLHASRLEQRGYNQALLLAQAICTHTGLELADGLLVRMHATDTQLHRDRAQRIQAMHGAFAVPDPAKVHGRHILLVDDVLTTGATAMSCAQALKDAGAQSVSLLTACRA